jgi:hypothetical protein
MLVITYINKFQNDSVDPSSPPGTRRIVIEKLERKSRALMDCD